jgi:uncharacterized protein (DUF58 family)
MYRIIQLREWIKAAVTYDCFPDLSRRVRRLVAGPLGVLVIAIAVAVLCGLFLHARVFAVAGGLGVVVALGVCWPWLNARGVRATIAFDRDRATEGDSVGLTVSITNHLPWPAWGLRVHSRPEPVCGDSAIAARLNGVDRRTRTSARWEFTPNVRGEYPRLPLFVSSGFPFGLMEAGRRLTVVAPLPVWPRTFPVGPVPHTDGDDVVEGNVTRNRIGSTGDVLGVRPYRRGDSPRRIHWPQTARHDRLIVCELQSTSRPVVLIVLDADAAVHSPGVDGSREWAIRVFASLAKGWLETGAQVGAAWDGAFFTPTSGTQQVARILDALARLPHSGHRALGDFLRTPTIARVRTGIRVGVTTDVGLSRLPRDPVRNEIRWAVLSQSGFGRSAGECKQFTCDEGPIRDQFRPWVVFDSNASVLQTLRYGWSEARHGS